MIRSNREKAKWIESWLVRDIKRIVKNNSIVECFKVWEKFVEFVRNSKTEYKENTIEKPWSDFIDAAEPEILKMVKLECETDSKK